MKKEKYLKYDDHVKFLYRNQNSYFNPHVCIVFWSKCHAVNGFLPEFGASGLYIIYIILVYWFPIEMVYITSLFAQLTKYVQIASIYYEITLLLKNPICKWNIFIHRDKYILCVQEILSIFI